MKTYDPRSGVEKVSVSFKLDLPRYNALQRQANKTGRSQASLLREGLTKLPGFNSIHQEEKEAYARNQDRNNKPINDFITKVEDDLRHV